VEQRRGGGVLAERPDPGNKSSQRKGGAPGVQLWIIVEKQVLPGAEDHHEGGVHGADVVM
jgi:hypothetical protein